MTEFNDSYIGKLRKHVGNDLLMLPGARVIIERTDKKILLQKRSDFGNWGPPGGNAEPGESMTVVAKREVFEETGLTVHSLEPFGFACEPQSETVTYPNGHQCQYFNLNYVCRDFSGALDKDNDETLDLQWFDLDDLPPMLFGMQKCMIAYQKHLQTGEFIVD